MELSRRRMIGAVLGSQVALALMGEVPSTRAKKSKKKCKNGPCTPGKCVTYVQEACFARSGDSSIRKVCTDRLVSKCCDGLALSKKPGNSYKNAVVNCVRTNLYQ